MRRTDNIEYIPRRVRDSRNIRRPKWRSLSVSKRIKNYHIKVMICALLEAMLVFSVLSWRPSGEEGAKAATSFRTRVLANSKAFSWMQICNFTLVEQSDQSWPRTRIIRILLNGEFDDPGAKTDLAKRPRWLRTVRQPRTSPTRRLPCSGHSRGRK
jgi:hypothetical protein